MKTGIIESRLVVEPNCRLQLKWGRYDRMRLSLQGVDADTYEPVVTFTVNMPEIPLKAHEILIKDYSENRGALATLVMAGVVKDTGRTFPAGMTVVHLVEILD